MVIVCFGRAGWFNDFIDISMPGSFNGFVDIVFERFLCVVIDIMDAASD